jgi:hypothetical protein
MSTVNVIKNRITNKVMFFLNGKQVFPVAISGNIYKFENGQNIIL